MTLLLDLGHSRAKLAVSESGRLSRFAVAEVDGLEQQLPALLEQYREETTTLVAVCVWHGESGQQFRTQVEQWWGGEVDWVDSARARGDVQLHYTEPETFGVDRLLVLHAARQRAAGSPCVVVDVGTALTIDALTSTGQHWGGWILPGPSKLHEGMEDMVPFAAGSEQSVRQVQFSSTGQAVRAGIWGVLSAGVEEMCRRCCDALCDSGEKAPRIYITGGGAQDMQAWLNLRMEQAPDLVLEGLAGVAERL